MVLPKALRRNAPAEVLFDNPHDVLDIGSRDKARTGGSDRLRNVQPILPHLAAHVL